MASSVTQRGQGAQLQAEPENQLTAAGLVASVTEPDGTVRFEPDRPVTGPRDEFRQPFWLAPVLAC